MRSFSMILSSALLVTSSAFSLTGVARHAMRAGSTLKMSISYKSAFMFPGQGAQTVGMAQAVCDELPAAKTLFEKASSILGYDLLQTCIEGPKEKLDSTVVAQTALFVSSMAALEKLKAEKPEEYDSATCAMGLSLGEYSALCFAGAFSFEDGVKLTKARGEAMQAAADACSSGMVAVVGLDKGTVEQICAEAREKSGAQVAIANYLVDGNYAVSGANEACEAVKAIAPEKGARMAVSLAVAGAFHTDFMSPAVDTLKKVLDEVEIKEPRIPVFSNVDAKPHGSAAEIKEKLAMQVTQPVQWETIITEMVKSPEWEAGEGNSYELGPGTVCRGIVKRFGKKQPVQSIQV